jgi:hypothetical protein
VNTDGKLCARLTLTASAMEWKRNYSSVFIPAFEPEKTPSCRGRQQKKIAPEK